MVGQNISSSTAGVYHAIAGSIRGVAGAWAAADAVGASRHPVCCTSPAWAESGAGSAVSAAPMAHGSISLASRCCIARRSRSRSAWSRSPHEDVVPFLSSTMYSRVSTSSSADFHETRLKDGGFRAGAGWLAASVGVRRWEGLLVCAGVGRTTSTLMGDRGSDFTTLGAAADAVRPRGVAPSDVGGVGARGRVGSGRSDAFLGAPKPARAASKPAASLFVVGTTADGLTRFASPSDAPCAGRFTAGGTSLFSASAFQSRSSSAAASCTAESSDFRTLLTVFPTPECIRELTEIGMCSRSARSFCVSSCLADAWLAPSHFSTLLRAPEFAKSWRSAWSLVLMSACTARMRPVESSFPPTTSDSSRSIILLISCLPLIESSMPISSAICPTNSSAMPPRRPRGVQRHRPLLA
mmetsp:Transcript_23852/g.67097  ORF Transcript_23852/g.67097 Transcript_23852/m.67097 type:complete len:410 (-) Transcript_23852:158-1387(-)